MVASIAPVASAAAATRYLENDGYYDEGSAEHRAASLWHGAGAAELGLAGPVEAERFRSVLEGYVPGSEQRIGRMKDGAFVHRPGIDITFSAPKSLSVAALIGGDRRLVEAHSEAVRRTMAWAETNVLVVRARDPETGAIVRTGGQKMVAASFLHDTSRNLDPQLHSHVVLANMARGGDGKWRAIESKAFYENKMLLGAVYHDALARGVRELGYGIETAGRNGVFELKGVYRADQLAGFSTRRREIEAAMRDRGLAGTPEQAAQAALLTRARKREIDRAALAELQRERAAALGVAWGDLAPERDRTAAPDAGKGKAAGRDDAGAPSGVGANGSATPDVGYDDTGRNDADRNNVGREAVPDTGLNTGNNTIPSRPAGSGAADGSDRGNDQGNAPAGGRTASALTTPTAVETVEWAVRHLEERNAVFTRRELLTTALARAPGTHGPERCAEAVGMLLAKGRLHAAETGRVEPGFTTDRAITAERETLAHLEAARGVSGPVANPAVVERRLDAGALTDGQKAAVRTILAGADRIVGVQGYAGSGKTTMLRQTRELAAEGTNGRNVIGLAPSASAARTLQNESGIGSRTLQHFLAKYGAVVEGRADRERITAARTEIAGSIIVVDEASLASTTQMRDLMRISEALGPARLVLVGDTRQLDAVDAGVPFRQLQAAGMDTAVMDQIMRQRDPELRAAVLDVLDGRPEAALETLGRDVLEAPREKLGETAAKRWLMLDAETRADTGLMAPTHALREEINEAVRADLRRDGIIHGPEAHVTRLDPNRLTRAESELASSYRDGDVVIFGRDLRGAGLVAGESYGVIGREDGRVLLEDGDGRAYGFDPAGGVARHVETYAPHDMTLQAGDRIRWTRNDAEMDLVNTHRAEITAVDPATGMVSLATEDGRALALPADAPQLQHADHAFNATVHAMQGRTADRAIAVLDSAHAELTTEKTFYVEISRARDRAIIVTDDRGRLAETLLGNSGEALSALQGIGAEPVSERGLVTQAEMAGVIAGAIETGGMTLEEHERIWDEIPTIADEWEYAGDGSDTDGPGYEADGPEADGPEANGPEREHGGDAETGRQPSMQQEFEMEM